MKIALFVCFFVMIGPVLAQQNLFLEQRDTLFLGHHLGGKMDSADVSFSQKSSTLPGGAVANRENTLAYDFLIQNQGAARFRRFADWKKMTFSALPHIGFGYVFGAQGSQFISANYQHAFGTKNLLNVNYDAQRGTGYLRNSNTGVHNVQLQFERKSGFYSFALRSRYLRSTINQSGGLATDTLIDFYPLIYNLVNKQNAVSNYRGLTIQMEHYFDFLANDSLNAFGIYLENEIEIFNRRYAEFDSLSLIYSVVQIHQDSTMDQYQLSELNNVGGIFFKQRNLFAKAGIQTNYWKYFNLGNELSRTEINLDGEVALNFKGFDFENATNFNFIGAKQEWTTKFGVSTRIKKFFFNGKVEFSQLLPEPFQRFYYGNNVLSFSSFDNLEKQFTTHISARTGYSIGNHEFEVFGGFLNLKDHYFFVNESWNNDTLNSLSYAQLGARVSTGYKILKVSLSTEFNAGKYIPTTLVQSRIAIQGRMFKSKKLLAQIGIEPSYHTSYGTLGYLPYMDVYSFTTPSTQSAAVFNLHVFTGFEVSQFRFFIRAENLGYFWNDRKIRVAEIYPIPGMQLRVGITWDFFN